MDKQLLSMLVCPQCKGKLKYEREAQELLCTFDGLAFPIKDGVPVMLDFYSTQELELVVPRALR